MLPAGIHNRIMAKRKRYAALSLSPAKAKLIEEQMRLEFVYNSNSIEGVTLSIGETELALRGVTVKGKSIADVLAAQNHPAALELIKDIAFSKRRIASSDMLAIHKALMSNIMGSAGEYRRGDVQIVGAAFTPPPAHMVPGEVEELVQFINENPDELRPVELAAHAHYYLAWIHPFDDGNGRLARLLMNMLLLRGRYPAAVIKKVDRKKYIDLLDRVSRDGEFEPFLIFIARCVEQSLDLYLNAGRRTPEEKMESLAALARHCPYSAEYLSLQARKGVLDAVKVGRVWMSTQRAISAYVKEHGRKRTA